MSSKTLEQGFYDSGSPISLSYSTQHFANNLSLANAYNIPTYQVGVPLTSETFFVEPFEEEDSQRRPDVLFSGRPEDASRTQKTLIVKPQPEPQQSFDEKEDNRGSANISTLSNQTEQNGFSTMGGNQPPVQSQRPEEAVVARDDQFEADLRDILAGKKRYDAQQKQAIPVTDTRTSSAQSNPQTGSSTSNPDSPVKEEFEKNEHAIFDKIAQSMKLSTAYDLGSIALENRFDAFDAEYDHLDEKKKVTPVQAAEAKMSLQSAHEKGGSPTLQESVNAVDFIQDLDKITEAKNIAQAFSNDIPLTPSNGGRSIGQDALEIGDVILSTTADARISGTIRAITRSQISHAAVYVGNGNIIEAIESGVLERSLQTAMLDDTVTVAFRHQGMTVEKARIIKDFLVDKRQVGVRFDRFAVIKNIPIQVISSVCAALSPALRDRCRNFAGRVFLGTETNNEFYCSELVFAAFEAAGLQLSNTEPHWTSGEDLVQLHYNGTLRYVGHLKTT